MFKTQIVFVIVLSALACIVAGELVSYTDHPDIDKLSPLEFREKVLNTKDLWLVVFYGPEDKASFNEQVDFEIAAGALKGIVRCGAINAIKHASLTMEYADSSFPTYLLFAKTRTAPIEIPRLKYSSKFLITAVLKEVRRMAFAEYTVLRDSRLSTNVAVKHTDSAGFAEVTKSSIPSIVLVYAPWSEVCDDVAEDFQATALEYAGRLRFWLMDFSTNEDFLTTTLNVHDYPSLVYFTPGGSPNGIVHDGGTKARDINALAATVFEGFQTPVEFSVLSRSTDLIDACLTPQFCLILFLDPSSQTEEDASELMDGIRSHVNAWGSVHASLLAAKARDFPILEDGFSIGKQDYPALVLVTYPSNSQYILPSVQMSTVESMVAKLKSDEANIFGELADIRGMWERETQSELPDSSDSPRGGTHEDL